MKHSTQLSAINTQLSAINAPFAVTHFDQLPDSAGVALPVVKALFDTSGATIWRWTKIGRLPRPHKVGPNSTRWNVGDLRRAMLELRAVA